jgi:hypothetical protein
MPYPSHIKALHWGSMVVLDVLDSCHSQRNTFVMCFSGRIMKNENSKKKTTTN